MSFSTSASTTGSSTLESVLTGPALVAARKRPQAAAQLLGQDLLQLRERPRAGLLEACHPGGGPEADGDGDRLVVVEQQRWKLGPDAQAVAAAGAADGVDGVAEAT